MSKPFLCVSSFLVCRYWWAKIRGLASIDDYEELERFSKQKKSPIGYEASCMCMCVECIYVYACYLTLKWPSHNSPLLRCVFSVEIKEKLPSTSPNVYLRFGITCTYGLSKYVDMLVYLSILHMVKQWYIQSYEHTT